MMNRLHGYRFKPTDNELLRYLEGFVTKKPLKKTFDFIEVKDLYGAKEPSELFGIGSDESTRYCFTELRRKSQHGSRFLRGVGDGGTWKGQDAGKPIRDPETKMLVGYKKSLRYETKRSKKETGGDREREVWLMKEYSISEDYVRGKNVVLKDIVLCRIKRKVRKTSRSQSTENIVRVDETLKVYEWPENDVVTQNPPPLDEDVSHGVVDQGVTNTEMIEGYGTTFNDLELLLMTDLSTFDDVLFTL